MKTRWVRSGKMMIEYADVNSVMWGRWVRNALRNDQPWHTTSTSRRKS